MQALIKVLGIVGFIVYGVTGAHAAAVETSHEEMQKVNSTVKGCNRYRVQCSPDAPKDGPPITLPPWDVCVDNCIRLSEELKLDKDEQQCCNRCDNQWECGKFCYDSKEYGDQTAFESRDKQGCKSPEDARVREKCEKQRHEALGKLED